MSQLDDVMARRALIRRRAARGRAMQSWIAGMRGVAVAVRSLTPAIANAAEAMRRFAEAQQRHPRENGGGS